MIIDSRLILKTVFVPLNFTMSPTRRSFSQQIGINFKLKGQTTRLTRKAASGKHPKYL